MVSDKDRIGVNDSWFNVQVAETVNDPAVRRKILQRINVLEKEAQHTLTAVHALKAELMRDKPFPSSTLGRSLKQMRDWVLSQAMSANYIVSMFETFPLQPDTPDEFLYTRAAREGLRQAVQDPDRKAAVHRYWSSQADP